MRIGMGVAAALLLSLIVVQPAGTQSNSSNSEIAKKGAAKKNIAKGTFEVKLLPQTDPDPPDETFSRMTIDKQFHGGVEGTSKGQMLAVGAVAKGSGVYVAVEKITATVDGRAGTFMLHHTGIMERNVPHLAISVVPDSGTGQLVGIAGTLTIKIEGGKHFYEFEYTLPESK